MHTPMHLTCAIREEVQCSAMPARSERQRARRAGFHGQEVTQLSSHAPDGTGYPLLCLMQFRFHLCVVRALLVRLVHVFDLWLRESSQKDRSLSHR